MVWKQPFISWLPRDTHDNSIRSKSPGHVIDQIPRLSDYHDDESVSFCKFYLLITYKPEIFIDFPEKFHLFGCVSRCPRRGHRRHPHPAARPLGVGAAPAFSTSSTAGHAAVEQFAGLPLAGSDLVEGLAATPGGNCSPAAAAQCFHQSFSLKFRVATSGQEYAILQQHKVRVVVHANC